MFRSEFENLSPKKVPARRTNNAQVMTGATCFPIRSTVVWKMWQKVSFFCVWHFHLCRSFIPISTTYNSGKTTVGKLAFYCRLTNTIPYLSRFSLDPFWHHIIPCNKQLSQASIQLTWRPIAANSMQLILSHFYRNWNIGSALPWQRYFNWPCKCWAEC